MEEQMTLILGKQEKLLQVMQIFLRLKQVLETPNSSPVDHKITNQALGKQHNTKATITVI